jgi:hypothetical protein
MEDSKHLCQSCHCLIQEDESYCSICGQKKVTKTITLREFMNEFFSNIFSLDSKFIRTFLPLFFLPGKLTNEYLGGKRKLYYTPIRLFLFWMTVSFILLNMVLLNSFSENNDLDRNLALHLKTQSDSLQKELNLVFPDSTSHQKIARIFKSSTSQLELTLEEDNGNTVTLFELKVSYKDFVLLNYDELQEKYKVEGFWMQQVVRQVAKFTKNPDDFQLYLFSHLSWIVLFALPLIALFLKLLYIRQKRPFVEHLIYTLHLHTFVLAITSFLFGYWLIQLEGYDSSTPLLITILLSSLYFFFSIKNVYKQGLMKRWVKIFIFFMGYCLIMALSLLPFLGLNFLFF